MLTVPVLTAAIWGLVSIATIQCDALFKNNYLLKVQGVTFFAITRDVTVIAIPVILIGTFCAIFTICSVLLAYCRSSCDCIECADCSVFSVRHTYHVRVMTFSLTIPQLLFSLVFFLVIVACAIAGNTTVNHNVSSYTRSPAV